MSRSSWEPGACSVLSATLAEPSYGSATTATSWLALEQPGPWGRQAATESHLDHELGGWLEARLSAAGGRLALIRSPGMHVDDHHGGPRRVLVASCVPGAEWLLTGPLDSPQVLAGLDFEALSAGDAEATMSSVPGLVASAEPHLLVCTNGRRDVCCAVRGRPVAAAIAADRAGRVWETSHTGGHRYAPTALLLPSGVMLARLDPAAALEALDAAGRGELPAGLHGPVHDRGRSALPPAVQTAQSAVRAQTGETRLDALTPGAARPHDGENVWLVDVTHADGRAWRVTVCRSVVGPDRPESCAKAPVPQLAWTAAVVLTA